MTPTAYRPGGEDHEDEEDVRSHPKSYPYIEQTIAEILSSAQTETPLAKLKRLRRQVQEQQS